MCWEYNQRSACRQRRGPESGLEETSQQDGENFYITAPFWCDYGYNIEPGENFYANHNLSSLIVLSRV